MREWLFLANSMAQGRCSRNIILKIVIYTLYFAFCSVFHRPTGNSRCIKLCRAPNSCSLVSYPAPQNKHLSEHHRELLGHLLEETSSVAEGWWTEWQDCHTTLISVIAKDTNCFLWTQSVWQSTHLQQEQGCSRARAELGVECDPCALPDASHNI